MQSNIPISLKTLPGPQPCIPILLNEFMHMPVNVLLKRRKSKIEAWTSPSYQYSKEIVPDQTLPLKYDLGLFYQRTLFLFEKL